MDWKRPVLVAASAVTVALLGCSRDTYDDPGTRSTVSAAAENLPVERTIPSGWAQTSAANPLGWADMAERRMLEFEHGSVPPSAIGGGPTSFDLDDDDLDDEHDDD